LLLDKHLQGFMFIVPCIVIQLCNVNHQSAMYCFWFTLYNIQGSVMWSSEQNGTFFWQYLVQISTEPPIILTGPLS